MLRKFMHPRNKYRTKPNFKQLAALYPEFRKHARTDLSGSVIIDFKNEETLRVLTQTLLKHDFDLDIEIPPNKLVPTLSLRLNYILWIEDLLKHCQLVSGNDFSSIRGLDIGTGAVCIYALLLAKLYSCKMLATEIDPISVKSARENLVRNNLQDLVKVLAVTQDSTMKDAVGDESFTFTICNPPFFDEEETHEGEGSSLSKLSEPKNAPTGCKNELQVTGGEKVFVTKMIEDSSILKDRIKVYTTMLGRRKNLCCLLDEIRKRGITNFTWTEFCQGNTKRWGLAWSFLMKDVANLTKAPVTRRDNDLASKGPQEKPALEIFCPIERGYSIDKVSDVIRQWIRECDITFEEIWEKNKWKLKLIAERNTWSHARRKRRMARDFENKESDEKNRNIVNTEESTSSKNGNSVEPLLRFFLEIEEVQDYNKIALIFDSGVGGRSAMETFRQSLINKLDLREIFQQQCSSAKKRKTK